VHRSIVLSLLLVIAGCAQVQASWDVEATGDLASRRTFSLEGLTTPPAGSAKGWERDQRLLRTLLLGQLTEKGYLHSLGAPDFVVRYVAGADLVGAAASEGGSLRGEIDVHVIDPTSRRWLWHGWASAAPGSRLDRDREIRRAVTEILAKFPPAS